MIRSMAFNMLEIFDCYWNVIHVVMAMATILDPRYKIELLEYYFPLIYGDKAKNEMICDYTSGRMGREGTRGTCRSEEHTSELQSQ